MIQQISMLKVHYTPIDSPYIGGENTRQIYQIHSQFNHYIIQYTYQ